MEQFLKVEARRCNYALCDGKNGRGAANLLKTSSLFQMSSEVRLPAKMTSSILSAILDRGLPFTARRSEGRHTNLFNVHSRRA